MIISPFISRYISFKLKDNSLFSYITLDILYGAFALYEYLEDNLYLVKYNDKYLNLFGFNRSTISEDINFYDYVGPDDRLLLNKRIKELLKDKTVKTVPLKCFDKTGALNDVDAHIYLINDLVEFSLLD